MIVNTDGTTSVCIFQRKSMREIEGGGNGQAYALILDAEINAAHGFVYIPIRKLSPNGEIWLDLDTSVTLASLPADASAFEIVLDPSGPVRAR